MVKQMARKSNVTNQVISYIRDCIQSEQWKVGEQIPSENQICAELNVSRISVRAAIQQYVALGIIQSRQGKGSFLISDDITAFQSQEQNEGYIRTPESIKDMKDLLDFRTLIEPEVCAQVAPHASDDLIEELSSCLDRMRESVGESAVFVRADMDFHRAIAKASGNPITLSVMQEVAKTQRQSYLRLNQAVGFYGGMYYHAMILDALKKHDAKSARNLMREHLQHSVGDLNLDNPGPEASK